jgi:hypothetical protein
MDLMRESGHGAASGLWCSSVMARYRSEVAREKAHNSIE